MHERDEVLSKWERDHSYLGDTHSRNEGRTRLVLVLTLIMMVAEIAAGTMFNSMALLADGWHMGSHAAALGIAALAYFYARHHETNAVYSFGTGKVGDLAGFASALVLALIALLMAWESVQRLLAPVNIAYDEAIIVAVVGLIVNLVSAFLLGDDHGHDHAHGHDDHQQAQSHAAHDHHNCGHDHGNDHHGHDDEHEHAHHDGHDDKAAHGDHNFRAVYVHVIADAVTSVLAIVALLAGRFWGVAWLDPVMGLVGAIVITRWAISLIGTTSKILLDAEPAPGMNAKVRKTVEADGDNRVADLHVWRLGPGHLAAMFTVVTHHPKPPGHYKNLLAGITGLSHVTVEVEECDDHLPHVWQPST